MKADLSNLWVAMDTGHGRNAQRPASVSGALPSREFHLLKVFKFHLLDKPVFSNDVCITDV